MAAAIITATMNGVFSGEPTYKGRTLSGWMKLQGRAIYELGEVEPSPAVVNEAIGNIGTNTIPFLLQMLTAQDSPWNIKVNEWLRSHQYWDRLAWLTADDWRGKAVAAFGCLKPRDAQAALPALMKLREHPDAHVQECAWNSLLRMQLDAGQHERLLREGLTNRMEWLRSQAMWELTRTNTPDVAIPILTQCLHDPSSLVRVGALDRLQFYQTNATEAVALFTGFLKDPDFRMRQQALILLQPYQTNTPEAVAFFIELLKDPDQRFHSYAAIKLAEYGNDALPALPALVAALQASPGRSSFQIAQIIFNLDRSLAKEVLTNGTWSYANFEHREKQAAEYKRFQEESKQKRKQWPGIYH